jgi:uncharacterized protein (UPF0335 family)
MNMPRTRPLVRFGSATQKTPKRTRMPEGHYIGGLQNKELLVFVGRIITYLPQIEERMIEVMALLMGDKLAPARQVFRSLNSEDARVKVMRSMLEQSHINRDKGREFDEIIDLFAEVKKARNIYAHGLWRSHHPSQRAFIQEASADETATFLSEREVKASELRAVLKRMGELWNKTLAVTHPEVFGPNAKRLASPETPPAPPHEDR